jgi:RNA polymerase sigma-70 factor (ECF subfamily)
MQAEADLGDLLLKVSNRDQAALRAIYVRQSTRLFGIAMAILRDRVAAADVLQDSFLRIWQRAGQFDPSRGEAQVWLGSIVRHAALDAVRARGREIPTDDPGLGDSMVEPDVIDSIAAADDGRRLQACLERLPAANREGIVLAFVHGLSHPEIAARLDLPLGTVKSWIRRGLLSLRECLS